MAAWRAGAFLLKGLNAFTAAGYERAAARFDNSCMQSSLAGRVCIVTGANSGLGLTTSHELARRGATLWMLCRDEARGAAAVAAVVAESGNQDVHLAVCDISSLASIAAFAARWGDRPCHVLVNNAGVLLNERGTTAEGFEASFATNSLGTAALTARLLPALRAGAPSRVITVSSGGMYTAKLHPDDFDGAGITPWDGSVAYARDKRRQVALTEHLAAAEAAQGVLFVSMHPGWADTEGVRTSIPAFHKALEGRLRSPAQGADTIVWLALEDAAKLQPGAFYLDRAPQAKHLLLGGTGYSAADAAELWKRLTQLAGLDERGGAEAAAAGGGGVTAGADRVAAS
ncbi:DHRS12 [Scenedesmus sp. PABB004]|nr:DHRS12 [Scenedesmus sp. PABB004]